MNRILRFLKWLYEFPAWVGEKLDEFYDDDLQEHPPDDF